MSKVYLYTALAATAEKVQFDKKDGSVGEKEKQSSAEHQLPKPWVKLRFLRRQDYNFPRYIPNLDQNRYQK